MVRRSDTQPLSLTIYSFVYIEILLIFVPVNFSEVLQSISIPVLVGSGVTGDNVQNYLEANALIIGSYFKKDGWWKNTVDPTRVQSFMEKVCKLR